tara:strand:- start:1402 stop:1800 length:399 start_codon:yes stop_codon:yes gene_type:complete
MWDVLITNVYSFYNYFNYTTETEKETEKHLNKELKEKIIQMEKINLEKDSNDFKNRLEFILSQKIKDDINDYELIQKINTEIQYINKKMTMVKGIADVDIEDIMLKTNLINLLKEIENRHFFMDQAIEIIND